MMSWILPTRRHAPRWLLPESPYTQHTLPEIIVTMIMSQLRKLGHEVLVIDDDVLFFVLFFFLLFL